MSRADRVDFFAKTLAQQSGLDGVRATIKRKFLVVDREVHFGERPVFQHANCVCFAADGDVGPVNGPGISVFFPGDGLDLRPFCFRLKGLPDGGRTIGKLELFIVIGTDPMCRRSSLTP